MIKSSTPTTIYLGQSSAKLFDPNNTIHTQRLGFALLVLRWGDGGPFHGCLHPCLKPILAIHGGLHPLRHGGLGGARGGVGTWGVDLKELVNTNIIGTQLQLYK